MPTILTFQINLLSVIRLTLPLHEGEYVCYCIQMPFKNASEMEMETPNQLIMKLKDIVNVDNKSENESENESHFQNGTKTD